MHCCLCRQDRSVMKFQKSNDWTYKSCTSCRLKTSLYSFSFVELYILTVCFSINVNILLKSSCGHLLLSVMSMLPHLMWNSYIFMILITPTTFISFLNLWCSLFTNSEDLLRSLQTLLNHNGHLLLLLLQHSSDHNDCFLHQYNVHKTVHSEMLQHTDHKIRVQNSLLHFCH